MTTEVYAKLTKTFFLSLPSGGYLVSNTGDSPTKPCFAEPVSSKKLREEQWLRIKMAQVDQVNCTVYISKKDYDKLINVQCPF